jgi:hypothetical protein
MVEKSHDNGTDHVIEPGAQTSARDDPALQLGRVEENLCPGASEFKTRRLFLGVKV